MRFPTLPSGPRRRTLSLTAGVLAGAAILAWGSAFAWGNSPSGRAFLRDRAGRAVRSRLGAVEIGDARLDLLLRARLAPVTVSGKDPARPLLRAGSIAVRPRLLPLLVGRVEPGSAAVRDAVLWPGADGTGLGPLDVDVDLGGGGAVDARVSLPGGGHLDLETRREEGDLAFRLRGRATLPRDLPAGVADRLPLPVTAGVVAIEGEGRARGGAQDLDATVSARASGLVLEGPLVGPAPVGPVALAGTGRITWRTSTRRLALDRARVTLGEGDAVGADLTLDLSLAGDRPFSLTARTAVDWRDLVAALPPDLGPPPGAPAVSGALSARASIAGALARRTEWDVRVDLDLEDLRRRARRDPSPALAAPFEWTPIDPGPDEPPRRIRVGPSNPAFLPYREAPPALVRAVTASEDGGFFGHRGFDFHEIASAIADRSRVRGASTLSQQLSKNLFLSPERSLSRKVREALGTIALEATLPKGRLLEIYLNIAEWGPGVYGAGEAARFWFGKDAREITPREAAFLATVLPSPRRFHAGLHRHGMTPRWSARIDQVLTRMRLQGSLTDEQLAAALAEPLGLLGVQHPPGPGDAGETGPLTPEPEEEPTSGRPDVPAASAPPR